MLAFSHLVVLVLAGLVVPAGSRPLELQEELEVPNVTRPLQLQVELVIPDIFGLLVFLCGAVFEECG